MARFGQRVIRYAASGIAAALVAIAWPVAAQDFPPDFMRAMALRSQPAPQAISAIEAYAATAPLAPEAKARLAEILAEARNALSAGKQAGALARLAEARALLEGKTWSPAQAFASSLTVSDPPAFATAGRKVRLELAQEFPAKAVPETVRLTAATGSAPPQVLLERPLRLSGGRTSIEGTVPQIEGRGALAVEFVSGDTVLRRVPLRVDFVPDLAVAEADARARLAKVTAGDDAQALVLYPYELAKAIAVGSREPEARNFADRLARSRAVLAALEAGRDPITRATGDQDRAYRFAETGEIVPYRIHVPKGWDGKQQLPVILALHGGGGDENGMLDLDRGKFGRLADRYGYIVVSPLGYRPLGAFGSPIRLPSVYGSDIKEGRAVGGPERAQLLARSERDTLDVLERTIAEYGADRTRVYVTGHSMGGGGTWYLAHQHPELFDAMAPSAGPFFIDGYDFERLRPLSIMIVQGSGDPPSLKADRQLAIDLLGRGFEVNYLETPSVNHGQTYGASLPSIFEFFERQKLRDKPGVPLELK